MKTIIRHFIINFTTTFIAKKNILLPIIVEYNVYLLYKLITIQKFFKVIKQSGQNHFFLNSFK